MTDDKILTHDAGESAFDSASGPVSDDGTEFTWDEEHLVHVDAPADLSGAFDTTQFYKITDATIARPIKQPYVRNGEVKIYKKPADELRKAAWSFDNSPFPIPHPDEGMVKDVNDVHGFWRNVRYNTDDEQLLGDLYIPSNDDFALSFIEDHQDVSLGFYNRTVESYDGDTGDLTDEDGVDGYQIDIYGDHIAGVRRGRCSSEDGCGLDSEDHGTVFDTVDADPMDGYEIAPKFDDDIEWTSDYTDDGKYFAVAPDENPDDEPKFPINNCSDVDDAWKLRGHGDIDISQDTLEERIKQKARDLNCDVPGTEEPNDSTTDCGCTDQTMTDENETEDDDSFDVPDLSVDALAEKNDAVAGLKEERDSLEEELDERESELLDALDLADNFDVELEEDECPCEAVAQVVRDFDSTVEEVEDLRDELSEYRAEEIEERLDTLEELGAERDEWESEADEAEDPIEVLDEEIERREEVLEATDNTTVKDVDTTTDSATDDSESGSTMHGGRRFERGYGA